MPKYRHPPVVERSLALHTLIEEEAFQLRIEGWKQLVAGELPTMEIITQWSLQVSDKDGMPVLDPSRQKMSFRQTFWKTAGGRKNMGIQLQRDFVSFNLLGDLTRPGHFEELMELKESWLPRWSNHFGVATCSGISLEYVNLLSKDTVPSFFDGKLLHIEKVLSYFSPLPSLAHDDTLQFVPPYSFEVNILIQREPFPLYCKISLKGEPVLGAPTLQLRIRAATTSPKRTVALSKTRTEIDAAHREILRFFDVLFTEEAKRSFDPT